MDYLNVGVFITSITILLMIDFASHRRPHIIGTSEALQWTGIYIFAALTFALFIYFKMGEEAAVLFITGYGLEKALAIDNLMVFIAIFAYFKIPAEYQHRILYLGILGAIILRLIFVFIGVELMNIMGPVAETIFAIIILYTAWLMYSANDEDEVDYNNTWYIKYTKKWIPVTTSMYKGQLFIYRLATPCFFALIAIELSDIMFAFDSVPTIIAITKDPFLIYAAIMFAVLGLRSLYFVIAALARNLIYFETAVIVVLIFIAAKLLLNAHSDIHIPPLLNLAIIAAILSTGIFASKIKQRII